MTYFYGSDWAVSYDKPWVAAAYLKGRCIYYLLFGELSSYYFPQIDQAFNITRTLVEQGYVRSVELITDPARVTALVYDIRKNEPPFLTGYNIDTKMLLVQFDSPQWGVVPLNRLDTQKQFYKLATPGNLYLYFNERATEMREKIQKIKKEKPEKKTLIETKTDMPIRIADLQINEDSLRKAIEIAASVQTIREDIPGPLGPGLFYKWFPTDEPRKVGSNYRFDPDIATPAIKSVVPVFKGPDLWTPETGVLTTRGLQEMVDRLKNDMQLDKKEIEGFKSSYLSKYAFGKHTTYITNRLNAVESEFYKIKSYTTDSLRQFDDYIGGFGRSVNEQNNRIADLNRSIAELTKSNNTLVATADLHTGEIQSANERIRQLIDMLKKLNGKGGGLSGSTDTTDPDNPFASAISDGKGQLAMLLDGIIEPRVDFESVVLPDALRESILDVVNQQAQQDLIFEKWGFGETMEKGKGMTMLFTGEPGTGKTMAAEALAKRLGYRFWNIGSGNLDGMFVGDFEKAVSFIFKKAKEAQKTLEEWEKERWDWFWEQNPELTVNGYANQGRLDEIAPEELERRLAEYPEPKPDPNLKGYVLLFDEADSIVAARDQKVQGGTLAISPVKAGQINHFLRKLEEFEGICIFATNRIVTLDKALERRISLIVNFPFPDQEAREKIWKRMIPGKAPLATDVDFHSLAKHEIAGGHIKNSVLGAARKAAKDQSDSLTQEHFLEAVKEQIQGKQVFNGQQEEKPAVDVTAIYGDNDMMKRILRNHNRPMEN